LQLNLVHRDVSRPFDHDLHVVTPGDPGQFSQGFKFCKLGRVTGIGNRPRTEPVAERESNIIFLEDPANTLEVLIQKILFVILHHPFRQNGAAATDDSGYAVCRQGDVLNQYACVDRHIVDALLRLFLDDLEH
jgi:hypothetical protein